jgi:YhcH/YjgK/YiaL family protein
MIYDHLKNIGLYKGLSPALDTALEFIETVTPDIEVGSHPLAHGVKAVVSAYETSLVNAKGYEAHRKYADIQLALVGTELVRCKPLPQVVETIPYDEAHDAARYADRPGADMVIGEGYFLVVFPDDAHEPGLAPAGVPAPVKKVVMKVPME